MSTHLKVGTRGSPLAMAQTRVVAEALLKKIPELSVETVVIQTAGDKMTGVPLAKIGSKGLFVKEIEDALIERRIDFAVHSLKDLTTDFPGGLILGAVTEREDPRDCLLSAERWTLKTLPAGAKVGTGSQRRQAQIAALRPDVRIESLRGNLDTRLRKLAEKQFDAIVVAAAGIRRLLHGDLGRGIQQAPIPVDEMLPAVGQGSLALQVRAADAGIRFCVGMLNHEDSGIAARCERALLRTLEGGCQVPIGALAEVVDGQVRLEALVAAPSGRPVVRGELSGPVDRAEAVGEALAERLLKEGAKEILAAIRN